jgi:hypothetical protein
MTMPQFTAEASLYRGGNYRAGTGGIPAGANAHGVSPANGCPKGQWCCRYPDGHKGCVPCHVTFFGSCAASADSTCEWVKGVPADDCSG